MTFSSRAHATFFVALVATMAAARGLPGQASAVSRALAPALEPLDFRPLEAPGGNIKLGGWLIPGHERAGTALEGATLSALEPRALRDSAVSITTVGVESVESLIAGADATTQRALAWGKPCFASPASLTGFRFHFLTSKARRSANSADLIDRVAAKVATQADGDRSAFEDAVVVWGIVTADIAISGCTNADVQQRLTDRLGELVWAYRAGSPTAQQGGGGDNPLVAILHLFELNSLARDRTVHITSIDVKPSGGMLSYLPRLQALGRNPSALPDEEYQQVGGAPTGPLDLWTGRFYFRLTRGGVRTMTVRDLTLADRDRALVLDTGSAGKP